jgi:phospholipase C
MENKSYDQILHSRAAPYEKGLARECGLADRYTGITNPSLPNYIGATSGASLDQLLGENLTDDRPPAAHSLTWPNLFGQVKAAGLEWRAYEESMPGNCALKSRRLYVPRHNPAAYYTPIRSDCAGWDVPLTASVARPCRDLAGASLPAFSFVTPNLVDDTHSSLVAIGDRWLERCIPQIASTPAYRSGHTVVFVTWDEGNDLRTHCGRASPAGHRTGSCSCPGGSLEEHCHVAAFVISPSTPPGPVSTPFNHYSLLHTTEELLGIKSYLGDAARAKSMAAAFRLAA